VQSCAYFSNVSVNKALYQFCTVKFVSFLNLKMDTNPFGGMKVIVDV